MDYFSSSITGEVSDILWVIGILIFIFLTPLVAHYIHDLFCASQPNMWWRDSDKKGSVMGNPNILTINNEEVRYVEVDGKRCIQVDIHRAAGDEWHTVGEIYDHRYLLYLMVIKENRGKAWFSERKSDGDKDEGWIIVGLETPCGQISYHLPHWMGCGLQEWGVEEHEKAPWDGHNSFDVLSRLQYWISQS